MINDSNNKQIVKKTVEDKLMFVFDFSFLAIT